MRIGTYNILGLAGFPPEAAARTLGALDSGARITHFQRVFETLNCDVLALQEGVEHPLITRLADGLQTQAITLPSPGRWPAHVLTRYRLVGRTPFSRPAADFDRRPFSRAGGWVRMAAPEGQTFGLIAVHLHPTHADLRRQEGEIVAAWVRELQRTLEQVIVLGDFNCEPTEPPHAALRALGFVNAMERAGGGTQPTVDAPGLAPCSLDHLYLSPALAPRLVRAEVVRGSGFYAAALKDGEWVNSDHLPVVAELE